MTLPAGFEALEPFVIPWAAASAAARDGLRSNQTAEARQAFYDAINPLLIAALDRLDSVPLSEHDAGEKALGLLTLSFAHVALAIEVQGPDEARHAINRQRLPILRTPADS
jgi:hypothetical protein